MSESVSSSTNNKYFGVQNGKFCFCGNDFSTKPHYIRVDDFQCTALNAGKNLYYGNVLRNAIYVNRDYKGAVKAISFPPSPSTVSPISTLIPTNAPNDIIPSTAAPTVPPTTAALLAGQFRVNSSQYIGCFADDISRDLPTYFAGWDSVSSLEGCQRLCYGFKFFAVQNGQYCYCGNDFNTKPRYLRTDDSECASKNNGRSLYYGDYYRNAVYKNRDNKSIIKTVSVLSLPIISSSQFIGCYQTNYYGYLALIYEFASSVGQCQNICVGYSYFGFQSNAVCFCSNSISVGAVNSIVNSNECLAYNYGRNLWWGGYNRIAIYANLVAPPITNDPTTSAPTTSAPTSTSAPTFVAPTQVHTTSAPTTTYCEAGNYLKGSSCLPCPAGSYSSTNNSFICTLCPVETYQDLDGQTSCIMCSGVDVEGSAFGRGC